MRRLGPLAIVLLLVACGGAGRNEIPTTISADDLSAPSATATPKSWPSAAASTPTRLESPLLAQGQTTSITLRGVTTANNGAGSAFLAVDTPTSVHQGNVLIAQIAADRATTIVTAPAGWNPILTTRSASSIVLASFYRVASAAEPGSYIWTFDTTQAATGGMSSYSNVDNALPIDAARDRYNEKMREIAVNQLITTVPHDMLAVLYAVSGNTTITPAPGLEARYQANDPEAGERGKTAGLATMAQNLTGQTSVGDGIEDALAGSNLTQLVALRPASAATPMSTPAPASTPQASGGALFVIMLENRDRDQVIGNASAPYLNMLAATNAQASGVYAVTHPSLPNRLAATSGSTQGVIDDDNYILSADNIFDRIESAGKNWRLYAEGMPSPCATEDAGSYVVHHNVPTYYASVVENVQRCRSHDVPLADFAIDIRGTMPDLVWIEPDNQHNGHDSEISVVDTWLRGFLPQILDSPSYQNGGKILILWDEGSVIGGSRIPDYTAPGIATGGNIPYIALTPGGPAGYVDSRTLTLYSFERTIADLLGIAAPGAGAEAPPLTNLFDGSRP